MLWAVGDLAKTLVFTALTFLTDSQKKNWVNKIGLVFKLVNLCS